MAAFSWRLGCWRPVCSPCFGEQRFGGGIDERHLARCRFGTRLVINKAVGMMLAGELSTSGANLISTRAKWDAEDLMRRTAPGHREAS